MNFLDLNVDFSISEYHDRLAHNLKTTGVSIENLARDVVIKAIQNSFEPHIKSGLINNVRHSPYPYGNDALHSLKQFKSSKDGLSLWYTIFKFDSDLAVKIEGIDLKLPAFLSQEAFNYGWGVEKTYDLREKILKTKKGYVLDIKHIRILPIAFEKIADSLVNNCKCGGGILHPIFEMTSSVAVNLKFICKICGQIYYCSCFKKALNIEAMRIKREDNEYAEDAPDLKFIRELKSARYREKICHLCTRTPSNLNYCHPMYGNQVMINYGPYVMNRAIQKDIPERDAENEIRVELGLPKIGEGWINETQLANIIKLLFPDKEMAREASPPWLNRLRLDIFLPELNLAIEYQGQQHFKPVDFFGGKDAHERGRERDQLKKKLCKKNGVDLIYFTHRENLTENLIKEKLRKYIPPGSLMK